MRKLSEAEVIGRLETRSMPLTECGCILWLGCINPSSDHGTIWVNGKCKIVHRFAWEVQKGKIPDGMQVLHKCDIPFCINVDHLFLGTQIDNIKDMVAKGRQRSHPKLTEDQVREIRKSKLRNRDLVKQYGMSSGVISLIRSGKIWKRVK